MGQTLLRTAAQSQIQQLQKAECLRAELESVQVYSCSHIPTLVHLVHIQDVALGAGSVGQVQQLTPFSDCLCSTRSMLGAVLKNFVCMNIL